MRPFCGSLAAITVALALLTGSASAESFELVPPTAAPVPLPALPSSEIPNEPGGILLPPNVFNAPFAPVRVLSDEELRGLWLRAGGAYGVPWQVLAAINKIETNFGRNMGPSSAGAVGWMQFMPDTWLRWGTDGSGDGIADPWDPEDGIFSAARYLAAAGAHTDLPRAVFAYNHAQWYVDDVLELAALFGGGGDGAIVFTLDRLGIALEEAQATVASVSEALRVAEAHEQELAAGVDAALAVAETPDLLLSDKLLAQRELFEVDTERASATAEIERLRAELAEAEAALAAAQNSAHAASFAPAAAGLLAAPTRADGYVFPVGGGPGTVSVGHEHHDYPAADIAAPMGAPVYALADAVVLELVDDGRCGTGLTLQTHDGLVWIYCHFSHRDGTVAPGTFLTAGQWIGLVGSTGNSTGPHLHLGLRPSRYPQEMPWFQEFAGLAFSWQDAPTLPVAHSGPIFALVPPTAPASEAGGEVIEFTLSRG
jgi:murein DD-endopeptidase MepM/ murein hydrolase activator NlpD